MCQSHAISLSARLNKCTNKQQNNAKPTHAAARQISTGSRYRASGVPVAPSTTRSGSKRDFP